MSLISPGELTKRPYAGALGNANKLKLGTFGTNLQNGMTYTVIPGSMQADWEQTTRIARLSDGMGFEAIVPVGRWRGIGGKSNVNGPSFDTFTWAAGIASVTGYSQVFSTVHVPIFEPLAVAKMIATIDHISGGRAGLNIVAGWYPVELKMFGHDVREHDERYEVAAEWATIIRDCWTRNDEFDFEGDFFDLRKVYSEPKPLQTPHPPIMNAGGSPRGMEFSAEFSDMAFITIKEDNFEDAARQVAEFKEMTAARYNREIKVWTLGFVSCADTEQEANEFLDLCIGEKYGELEAGHTVLKGVLENTGVLGNADYDHYLRRFMAGGAGLELVGTPEQIVDRLQYVSDIGCEGILLSWPIYEAGLEQWQQKVLPLLEQAGLREPYIASPAV